jgi:hypothetical protein
MVFDLILEWNLTNEVHWFIGHMKEDTTTVSYLSFFHQIPEKGAVKLPPWTGCVHERTELFYLGLQMLRFFPSSLL